jgi:hypothetical protein
VWGAWGLICLWNVVLSTVAAQIEPNVLVSCDEFDTTDCCFLGHLQQIAL